MEDEILSLVAPGEEFETSALVTRMGLEKKSEINPSLYRLASLGYIEKINIDPDSKSGSQRTGGSTAAPPKWRRIVDSLPEVLIKTLGAASEPVSIKDLVASLQVKKSALNSCLYALERRKVVTVIKDESGFDPRWKLVTS